jgi:hypothetical protein
MRERCTLHIGKRIGIPYLFFFNSTNGIVM